MKQNSEYTYKAQNAGVRCVIIVELFKRTREEKVIDQGTSRHGEVGSVLLLTAAEA